MQDLLPRVESGTETENNAGAVAEAQRGRSYASCVCDISASMHVTQRKDFIAMNVKNRDVNKNYKPNRIPSCRHAYGRYPSLILLFILITRT